jgi:3-oxoacyl-(acyl-carrier-protein) synthase
VLGAASTCGNVCEAALPFDKRRNGMILGAGAVGLVFETVGSLEARNKTALSMQMPSIGMRCCCVMCRT